MEVLHKTNIIIHVIAGIISLLLAVIALMSRKGGRQHNTMGRYFLRCVAVVIFTGLIGVFIYGRNGFLLVITVLVGYESFSGFRVLRNKSNQPKSLDIAITIISVAVLVYFFFYFKSIGLIWSAGIIFSTVGAFVILVVYDLLRFKIPKHIYVQKRIWLYEHIYKMTSAFTGLLAAFSGTVLEQYQPHSQYLPSIFGVLIIILFMVSVHRKGLRFKSGLKKR